MTATAVPRETRPAPRPVAAFDDILLELVDIADNVRVDAGELDELAASIAELGVLQPIKVTTQPDGRYRAVYGQRRVLASRQLGRLRIPAIVQPAGDVDAKGARRSIEQLAENLQRKDLNPIEEAVALREVLEATKGLTQEALADKLGMSRPWVSNTLRLLQADPVVQDGVRAGTITASHAKSLVVLPAGEQRSLAERIVKGMSAHDLENTLRWKLDEVKVAKAKAERTAKYAPKAPAALEEAGVPKGSPVYLQGAYNLDSGPIEAAIRKAGWAPTREYAWDRGTAAKCDCAVVRLEFNRTWKVSPACNDDKHQDRQRNNDHLAERKREEAIEAKVNELAGLLDAALAALPIPPVLLRLMAARNCHELPELLAGGDDVLQEVRALVAQRLAEGASSRYAYGSSREAADRALDAVLEAMRPPSPAATGDA